MKHAVVFLYPRDEPKLALNVCYKGCVLFFPACFAVPGPCLCWISCAGGSVEGRTDRDVQVTLLLMWTMFRAYVQGQDVVCSFCLT